MSILRPCSHKLASAHFSGKEEQKSQTGKNATNQRHYALTELRTMILPEIEKYLDFDNYLLGEKISFFDILIV